MSDQKADLGVLQIVQDGVTVDINRLVGVVSGVPALDGGFVLGDVGFARRHGPCT